MDTYKVAFQIHLRGGGYLCLLRKSGKALFTSIHLLLKIGVGV
jgi:hypothetical protein